MTLLVFALFTVKLNDRLLHQKRNPYTWAIHFFKYSVNSVSWCIIPFPNTLESNFPPKHASKFPSASNIPIRFVCTPYKESSYIRQYSESLLRMNHVKCVTFTSPRWGSFLETNTEELTSYKEIKIWVGPNLTSPIRQSAIYRFTIPFFIY